MSPVLIRPRRFADSRGWFSESWNANKFATIGIEVAFCQDNQSLSRSAATLRGLHFQTPPHAQAKLVRCLKGRIFDVAVDIRRASPSYGRWVGAELSAAGGEQLFIPAGYAHGFLTLEEDCEIAYKVDAFYSVECDGGVAWDDPALAIDWPLAGAEPVLSEKDAVLPRLHALAIDFPYDGIPLSPLSEVVP